MTDLTPTYDVLVIGAGPAGLAATAALAERELRVGAISPTHPPRWPNTYGIWHDEFDAAGLTGVTRQTWPRTLVELPEHRTFDLDRTYALIDNDALRTTLLEGAERAGVEWLEGVVDTVDRDLAPTAPVRVRTRSGDTWTARLAIDATGHRSPSEDDQPSSGPGYQVAVGQVLATESDGPPPDAMTLMDFRHPDGADASGPPTFLYEMATDDRRLLEETVLVSRPKAAFDRLEERLRTRLRRRGWTNREVLETERVVIPMGRSLPEVDPDRGLLPFGAAAEMVHPASGYMVGRTLLAAEPMADAVAETLHRRSGPTAAAGAVRAGWRAIWPRDLVRTRHLLRFGMEALVAMDARQTYAFFDAFFSLPSSAWRDYLSGTAGPGRTARIMMDVFSRASLSTKTHLTKMAISPHARHLFRSLAA